MSVVFSGVAMNWAPCPLASRMNSEVTRMFSATSSDERSWTQAARKAVMTSS